MRNRDIEEGEGNRVYEVGACLSV